MLVGLSVLSDGVLHILQMKNRFYIFLPKLSCGFKLPHKTSNVTSKVLKNGKEHGYRVAVGTYVAITGSMWLLRGLHGCHG